MDTLPARFGESTPAHLAALAGVSLRTARRWKTSGQIPRTARILIALKVGWLSLGVIAPGWQGWRIVRGELVSPDGLTFTPGELAALPYRYQQLRALERAESIRIEPARRRA